MDILNGISGGALHLSEGTRKASPKKFNGPLKSKQRLIQCNVLGADETGCRVNGKLNWIQVFSKRSTLYDHFEREGLTKKLGKKDTKAFQRFSPKHRNQRWQGDTCHLLYITDPKNAKRKIKLYFIAWLDEAKRIITHGLYPCILIIEVGKANSCKIECVKFCRKHRTLQENPG